MIYFDEKLKEILNNNPLGIVKDESKVSTMMNADNRLKASFEAINELIMGWEIPHYQYRTELKEIVVI